MAGQIPETQVIAVDEDYVWLRSKERRAKGEEKEMKLHDWK